jgi:glutamyl-tRNA reductase
VSLVAIGLNHRTAPLELLERMAIDAARMPKALGDVATRANLSEAVVLSTCNRIEVYAVAERFHGGFDDVRDFLAESAFLAPEDFADHLFVWHGDEAVSHLFEVAAGLDSAVLGESEILGQVGDAWHVAREEGATGASLNLLFRHALEVGKRVRTDTGIARGITSLSQAAVALAAERLGGLAGRRALVVGAGDMGEGMAMALARAGVDELLVANRSAGPAEALAERAGGRAISLFELTDHLAGVDLLLTSTGASSPVVEQADVLRAMAERPDRPLLVIDIAVPRDVDPAVGDIPGVTVLDMDDLRAFAAAGAAGRQAEAAGARAIVDTAVERYLDEVSARGAVPVIRSLRDRAESVRQAELDRVAGRLAGLDDQQRDAVEAATRAIVAKLVHEPIVRVKDAAGSAKGDRLADSLRDLFDL